METLRNQEQSERWAAMAEWMTESGRVVEWERIFLAGALGAIEAVKEAVKEAVREAVVETDIAPVERDAEAGRPDLKHCSIC